ncbi:MAG: LuxR C-terminal-related transcriptional regulator [Sedimentisphaerales bacterium]|nr:LuxR C-terminal-related transcriptional regulator [Sedimentisphaerales bacterium]
MAAKGLAQIAQAANSGMPIRSRHTGRDRVFETQYQPIFNCNGGTQAVLNITRQLSQTQSHHRPTGPLARLTRTQLEILRYICKGMSNKEIA